MGNGENPYNAEHAGPKDSPDGRHCGVSHTPKESGGNFKETAQGLPEDDDKKSDARCLDDGRICGKQTGRHRIQEGSRYVDGKSGKEGQSKADFPGPKTAVPVPGTVILAYKGRSGLSKGGDYIVREIFYIQGNCISCDRGGAKGVDHGLHENVGKAEDSPLEGGGNADFRIITVEGISRVSRPGEKRKGPSSEDRR